MPGFGKSKDLPVKHPRDVSLNIERHVEVIEKGLALHKPMARKNQVTPGSCGGESAQNRVKGWDDPNSNPNHDPWYVGYSPYSLTKITYVDANREVDVRPAMVALHQHLMRTGWKLLSFSQPANGRWQLRAESPERGYGGIMEGPTANGRRITVIFSSPCFRHPEELPEA